MATLSPTKFLSGFPLHRGHSLTQLFSYSWADSWSLNLNPYHLDHHRCKLKA